MTLTRRKFLGAVAGLFGLSLVPFGLGKLLDEETILLVQLEGSKEASTVSPKDFILTSVEGPEETLVRVRGQRGDKRVTPGEVTFFQVYSGDEVTIQLKESSSTPTIVSLVGRKV